MQINVIYDQSQGSLPSGFVAAVNYVVNYFDTTFTNNVTVNIDLGYGEIAGQSLGSGALGESETFFDSFGYSQAVNALKANQPSATQQSAYSTLPGLSPLGGGTLWVSTAEEKALGLLAGNNSAIDGYVGFSSSYPFDYSTSAVSGQYYFDGVVAHEFSEVLGRDSLLGEGLGSTNSYSIMDLFRYSAAGTRQLGTGGPAYFSINNGTTNLDSWNTNPSGDLGDWASSAGVDSFLAFSPTGQADWVTPTDVTLMNVLGWDSGPPSFPPVVTTSNLTEPPNKTLAGSSLFTVTDPNGNAITEYEFWDAGSNPGSGHFYLNGVQQAQHTTVDIAASQLGSLTYVTGSVGDQLQIRAFDGVSWSEPNGVDWSPFNVSIAAVPPPVVTTSNLTEPPNKTLAGSSLFTVSDPNGYAITEYEFWDAGSNPGNGHFYLNGVQQAQRTTVDIAASQLGSLTYVTGSAADQLQIRAFDGVNWSEPNGVDWSPFNVSIAAGATAPPPVVTTSNLTEPPNKTLAGSSLFTVSDPNGNAITEYEFWDAGSNPGSGHFYLNGVQQTQRTTVDIAASQLGSLTYVTGSAGDQLQIRAFDGVSWSEPNGADWSPFNVGIAAVPPPVVTTSNLTEPPNKTLTGSSLFTVSDPNGNAITEYEFWDAGSNPGSGHFYLNGVQQAQRTTLDIAASQLGSLTYVTGSAADQLQIRAFDGVSWSEPNGADWSPFNVSIAAVPPPVVTTSNLTEPPNKTLAGSSLFTVSDPNGNAITEYEFWDAGSNPGSGHFYLNGVQQAQRTTVDIAASQLGSLTYVTGSAGDQLQIRAFDGVSWSEPNGVDWSPFNVSISGADQPSVALFSQLLASSFPGSDFADSSPMVSSPSPGGTNVQLFASQGAGHSPHS